MEKKKKNYGCVERTLLLWVNFTNFPVHTYLIATWRVLPCIFLPVLAYELRFLYTDNFFLIINYWPLPGFRIFPYFLSSYFLYTDTFFYHHSLLTFPWHRVLLSLSIFIYSFYTSNLFPSITNQPLPVRLFICIYLEIFWYALFIRLYLLGELFLCPFSLLCLTPSCLTWREIARRGVV